MYENTKQTDVQQVGEPQVTGLYALPLTPYRALYTMKGADHGLIPEWAHKREVYRSIDRTRYVVETNSLEAATSDIELLRTSGWNVEVQRLNLDGSARITMSAGAAQTAA